MTNIQWLIAKKLKLSDIAYKIFDKKVHEFYGWELNTMGPDLADLEGSRMKAYHLALNVR